MLRKMFIHILLYSIILLYISFACGIKAAFPANEIQEEMVNPHWTGKHCQECHLEENPQEKGAQLKFDGNPVKLCNRCHETELARADIHPVGVAPLAEMKEIFPDDFPLEEGKLSCLTCHEALLQMKVDFALKTANPKFIRGAPYETLVTFCFSCHLQEEYKKTNPHKQLDAQGRILEKRCLFCHQSLPEPAQVTNIGGVFFKSELALYCINCHPQEKTGHPARADHLVELPDFMKESLPLQLTALQVDLPLDGEHIFCGTCHNPHEKGVIQRQEAQHGAGEKYFLRLNGGYELCISCHNDKQIPETKEQVQQKKALPAIPKMLMSFHKPMKENKCKLCHIITPENMEKPKAMFLCFKQDCHKTDILEKEFTHEKTVVENCYLCHRSHASVHEKLLRSSKEKLCYACHPLLRDKNQETSNKIEDENISEDQIIHEETSNEMEEKGNSEEQSIHEEISSNPKEKKSNKEHSIFMEYLKTTPIPEGNECGFCHSPYHKSNIGQMDMEVCSDCHIYIRGTLSNAASVPINVHQTFQDKSCPVCHDPHAAQYHYLLKQPPEYYLNPDSIDSESPSSQSPTVPLE